MCIFGGGGGAATAAANEQTKAITQQNTLLQQQADEAKTDAQTRTDAINAGKSNIDSAFSGFNDDFFNQLGTAYKNYAQPQLDDQYGVQKNNITYALARNGTTNSSIMGDEMGQLSKQYADNETQLNSTADNYANTARANVAADKSDVTNQLLSSGDNDAATTSALSAAKALAVPPTFSPLGNLFTNISAVAAQNKLASDSNAFQTGGAQLYGSGGSTSYGVPNV